MFHKQFEIFCGCPEGEPDFCRLSIQTDDDDDDSEHLLILTEIVTKQGSELRLRNKMEDEDDYDNDNEEGEINIDANVLRCAMPYLQHYLSSNTLRKRKIDLDKMDDLEVFIEDAEFTIHCFDSKGDQYDITFLDDPEHVLNDMKKGTRKYGTFDLNAKKEVWDHIITLMEAEFAEHYEDIDEVEDAGEDEDEDESNFRDPEENTTTETKEISQTPEKCPIPEKTID